MPDLPEHDGDPCWDDALADLLAAVEAARSDDAQGQAVIFRHGNRDLMLIVAVKLLGTAAEQNEVSPAWFRDWARQAVTR